MFDGSDEFHQFMASRTSSLQIPIPIPIPIAITPPLSFDPYSAAANSSLINNNNKSKDEDDIDFEINRSQLDPWSNDELIALLKATSTMEIWFPDFTWEHISRKLVELGFKRSAEQCKRRFQQETKHLNTSLNYNSNNYRVILSELDELHPNLTTDTTHESMEKQDQADQEQVLHNNEDEQQQVLIKSTTKRKRKRKRKLDRFEIFKDFCESIVNKMIVNQEELHKKLIEDIAKRDEENIAREEALRNQEIEKINLEIQIRTKDQASSSQRQATLINFLNKFTFPSNINPNPEQIPQETSTHSEIGKKRWPRDEVLALINLRCKINGDEMSSGGNSRGPLWERISQGMMELGYKRNSKRCKEKWENINKYFRKTKDSNKKRAIDSRTCPYFHHLSSLYTDATQSLDENQ